jgi:hypothetical protein
MRRGKQKKKRTIALCFRLLARDTFRLGSTIVHHTDFASPCSRGFRRQLESRSRPIEATRRHCGLGRFGRRCQRRRDGLSWSPARGALSRSGIVVHLGPCGSPVRARLEEFWYRRRYSSGALRRRIWSRLLARDAFRLVGTIDDHASTARPGTSSFHGGFDTRRIPVKTNRTRLRSNGERKCRKRRWIHD